MPTKTGLVSELHYTGFSGTYDEKSFFLVLPGTLTVHPQVSGFPNLGEVDYARLKSDISEHGRVLDALLVNSRKEVLNGRQRLKIALELGFYSVPILVDDDLDPVQVAISTAIARRQLSMSGIVLLLWEQHPELRRDRELRQRRFLLKKSRGGNPNLDDRAQQYACTSYRQLAARYHVDKDYFSHLNGIFDNSEEAEWEDVRGKILSGEAELSRLWAGMAGRVATKGMRRKTPDPVELIQRTFDDFSTRLGGWNDLHAADKHRLFDQLNAAIQTWPEEFVTNLRDLLK